MSGLDTRLEKLTAYRTRAVIIDRRGNEGGLDTTGHDPVREAALRRLG